MAAAQLGGLGGLTNLTAANGAAALGLMGAAPTAAGQSAERRRLAGRSSTAGRIPDWALGREEANSFSVKRHRLIHQN